MNKIEKDNQNTASLAAELRAQLSKLNRCLREQADPGYLPPSQIAVILRLENIGSATVSELSRLEGVRPQSMRTTVSALKEQGYIEGVPDPADGRKMIISLTEECRRMVTEGRNIWNDWLTSSISKKLTHEEQALLSKAVELLKRLTDY